MKNVKENGKKKKFYSKKKVLCVNETSGKILKAKKKEKLSFSDQPKTQEDFSKNWKSFLEEQKKKGNIGEEKPKVGPMKKKPNQNHKRKEKIIKKEKESSTPVWFDDVDPLLLERECGVIAEKLHNKDEGNDINEESVNDDPNSITKYVAIDCEMVGISYEGKENALARVSIVNISGQCIYDKYVKPAEKVVDYRTAVSGIRPSDLKDAPSFEVVQKEVSDILKDRVLVGHALKNDMDVLMLSHSRKQIRDTSRYKPFRELLHTKRPALRKLAAAILKETIQDGEHSSVVDARATMRLYTLHRKEWEKSLHTKTTKPQEIFIGGNLKKKKNNKWTKKRQNKDSD